MAYTVVFEAVAANIAEERSDTVVSFAGQSVKDMIVKTLREKASLLDLNSLTFDTGKWIRWEDNMIPKEVLFG